MGLHQVTMPRRFRSKSPINSIKHIIDSTSQSTPGLNINVPIANAVANTGTTFNPVEVRVGATINAFFLSVFMIGSGGAGQGSGSLDWYIWKEHAGQAASVPDPGSTGVSEIRNQIIHEEKGLAGSGDGTPMAFKGVIMIPRGMRRMREGDVWNVRLKNNSATGDVNLCVKAIYKSYF